MMIDYEKSGDVEAIIVSQFAGHLPPHPGLLEQRVLELERMGMPDEEEMPGIPSSARQYATASLQHRKPAYFVTYDNILLEHRDALESRYGLEILSVYEAALLLQQNDGPPN